MNVIASFFLRAKHWQIFLLLVGVGFVGNVALMISLSQTVRSPQDFANIGVPFGAVTVLLTFCLLAWFWSMGSFLSSIVQPTLRLKMGFFRFALIYPLLYIFVFAAFFQSTNTKPQLLAIIFPLHFFAVFCVFYDLYFVAKSLVLAETSKPASFYDYAGPFFLIWFFPIGIWFTQPRINRLYERPTPSPTAINPETLSSPVAAHVSTPAEHASAISAGAPAVYAGFWLRLAAAVIDAFVMFILFFVITFIVVVIYKLASAANERGTTLVIFVVWPVLTTLATSFYFALLESSPRRATLGKMAVALYVSDIEGHRLTLGRAMGRTLAKYLSILTVGIGFVICGFTEKKQALHDKITSCLVLRRQG
jgi:uncharacterized RDD family membrane protein YckC